MKPQRKITRSEKKLFLLTGIILVSIIGFGAWWQAVNAIPDVKIPTQKMPSPNAYDFYVKAITAAVPANSPVDPTHDSKRIPEAQWKTYYPTAKKETWLQANAKSFKLLRQGFKYPCRVPPQRSLYSSVIRTPSYADFRAVARTLIIESHARSERENWSGAADSTLDVLRLGNDLSQGGTLIDYLVGSAINAIGRRGAWEILPRLNAVESKAAAQRLEKIFQTRVAYADVMREEKYSGQASLLQQMRSNEWSSMSPNDATGAARLIERWQVLKTPRREIFNNYTAYMDAIIAAAEKPYETKVSAPTLPNDFYNQMLGPVYENARWYYARDESGNALFLVALALRAYKLEHKTYPQNLRELVPNYLQRIPADPFGGGEELRYRRAGREYSLYSIGPDGVDNRGRAIEDTKVPKAQMRKRFLVQPESKGDVVASVN